MYGTFVHLTVAVSQACYPERFQQVGMEFDRTSSVIYLFSGVRRCRLGGRKARDGARMVFYENH